MICSNLSLQLKSINSSENYTPKFSYCLFFLHERKLGGNRLPWRLHLWNNQNIFSLDRKQWYVLKSQHMRNGSQLEITTHKPLSLRCNHKLFISLFSQIVTSSITQHTQPHIFMSNTGSAMCYIIWHITTTAGKPSPSVKHMEMNEWMNTTKINQ